ncbi:hypothetical protein Q9Q99_03470 [Curtobacterium flaccumfaciens]|nr:hypothetical protein Q9Q99_03470 [Curtobacterium flaccumfaciens]
MSRVVRRPRSAVRRPVTISVVAVLLLVAGYLVAAAVVPFGPASASTTTYSAPRTTAPALSFPGYGATAVEATDFPESLRTSGDTKPRSIASITKVVTALVVLDEKPMAPGQSGPAIRFTKQMEGLYAKYAAQNGEVAPMPAGLKLTEHQAFQVMLMKSANNYAGALAIWAFGSLDAYERAAAKWLDEQGLDDTTIHEPTGLDPDNTSTATDLVELGQLALANPVVKDIVGTQDVTIPTVGAIENSEQAPRARRRRGDQDRHARRGRGLPAVRGDVRAWRQAGHRRRRDARWRGPRLPRQRRAAVAAVRRGQLPGGDAHPPGADLRHLLDPVAGRGGRGHDEGRRGARVGEDHGHREGDARAGDLRHEGRAGRAGPVPHLRPRPGHGAARARADDRRPRRLVALDEPVPGGVTLVGARP